MLAGSTTSVSYRCAVGTSVGRGDERQPGGLFAGGESESEAWRTKERCKRQRRSATIVSLTERKQDHWFTSAPPQLLNLRVGAFFIAS